jgi:hydrogenase nickel incorporation protein HypA/HybF
MQHAYPFAAAGSLAEESKLLIELSPLKVRCEGCGSETEVEPSLIICAVCGSHHTELVSGDEMTLMSVELVTRGEADYV